MVGRLFARATGRASHAFVFALALLSALAQAARAETPIPPFPESGVAVAGVPDTLDPVRELLRTLKSKQGARYTVLLVAYTSERDIIGLDAESAKRYTDAVVRRWTALDPASHVLIVVSKENRNLTVHTGSRWVRLGLDAAGNVEFLNKLEHGKYFRANDYAGGIAHVIERTDAEIESRVGATAASALAAADRAGTDRNAVPDREAGERWIAETRAELARTLAKPSGAAQQAGAQPTPRAPAANPAARGGSTGTLVVIGALGTAIAGAGLMGARSGARRKAGLALAAWEKSFGGVATKILALEEEHPFVKDRKGLGERLTGRSKKAFEETGKLLDGLFVAFHAAETRGHEAKDALARDGALRWKGASEVLVLLSETPIDLDGAGGQPPLPAKSIVSFMEQALHLAKDNCALLQTALLDVKGALEEARGKITACGEAIAPIAQKGLSTAGYDKLRVALVEKADAITTQAETDPIEACDAAKALAIEAYETGKRATYALHMLATLSVSESKLASITTRVAMLRGERDMPVKEEGLDPEALTLAAQERASAGRKLVEAGDEVRAAEEGAQCARFVFELEGKVDRSMYACIRGMDEATALGVARESRRDAIEKRLGELRLANDPDALAAIEAEAQAGHKDLAGVDVARAEALKVHAAKRHWATALALEKGHDALRHADERKAALEEKAKGLLELKRAATASLAKVRLDVEGAEAVLQAGQGYLPSDAVRRSTAEARAALEAEVRAQAEARPHWPRRAEAAHALTQRAALAKAEAAKEQKSCMETQKGIAALRAAAPGTGARAAALLASLGAEHAERDVAPLRAQSVTASTALAEGLALAEEAEGFLGRRGYGEAETRLRAGEARLAAASAIEVALASAKAALDAARAKALEVVKKSEEKVRKVGAMLASSSIDREQANRTFKEAEALLEDARRIGRAGRTDWPELAELALRAERRAHDAEQRARADFQAADAAQQAINAARKALADAERDHGYGERGATGHARRHLDDAQADLTRREYERALDRAHDAEREAALAGRQAQARAADRKRQEDAERHRREEEERKQRAEKERRERDEREARERKEREEADRRRAAAAPAASAVASAGGRGGAGGGGGGGSSSASGSDSSSGSVTW